MNKNSKSGFLAVLLAVMLVSAAAAPAPAQAQTPPELTATWTKKLSARGEPNGPGRRGWIRFVHDPVAKKMVLMAGSGNSYLNDVWHYDTPTDAWTKLEPYVSCAGITGFTPPTPRDEQVVEYDPFNHLYWMFGGSGFGCQGTARAMQAGSNSTTIVDSTLTATTPDFYKDWTVKVGGTIVFVDRYDPVAKSLTLSVPVTGAVAGAGYFLFPQRGGQMWSYSPTSKTWSGHFARPWGYTGPAPTNRLSPAFAYSTVDRAILMFGGYSNGPQNDLWAFDVETKSWLQMRPTRDAAGPAARTQLQNSMAYDSANDVFVLFGGQCGDSARCVLNAPQNDTWLYRLSTNTWSRVTPPVSPPPRTRHHMAYDPVNGVIVMFGGLAGSIVMGDLWTYHVPSNTWTQIQAANPAPGRFLGALGYDPDQRMFVLYAGNGPVNVTRDDLWTLQLTNAFVVPNTPPIAVATASPSAGSVITTFQFDGSGSSDPDGSVISYLWNFGDGTTSALAAPTKVYASPGVYPVTLTVRDDRGASALASVSVEVAALSTPPEVTLTNNRISGTINDPSVTSVLVNGVAVPVTNGSFEAVIPLPAGTAVVNIQAIGSGGTTTRRLTLTVE
jgi:hypothetical protein